MQLRTEQHSINEDNKMKKEGKGVVCAEALLVCAQTKSHDTMQAAQLLLSRVGSAMVKQGNCILQGEYSKERRQSKYKEHLI